MIKKGYPKLRKNQGRIKKWCQGQEDPKRIKKGLKKDKKRIKKGYPKLRKNQGRIKQGYPGQGQEDKKMIKKDKKRISKIEEKSGEDKKG